MFTIGKAVQVIDETGVWRDSIIKENNQDGSFTVHFNNWRNNLNNGSYSVESIREPIEARLIGRNDLKCKSIELERLILKDDIQFQRSGKTLTGSVIENDKFKGEVRLVTSIPGAEEEIDIITVNYESIHSMSISESKSVTSSKSTPTKRSFTAAFSTRQVTSLMHEVATLIQHPAKNTKKGKMKKYNSDSYSHPNIMIYSEASAQLASAPYPKGPSVSITSKSAANGETDKARYKLTTEEELQFQHNLNQFDVRVQESTGIQSQSTTMENTMRECTKQVWYLFFFFGKLVLILAFLELRFRRDREMHLLINCS